MTIDEYFIAVSQHLPIEQREDALHRMRKAHEDGIEHIGLWTGEGSADITDLVGNCPRKREELRNQGDDWSSGLIGLQKYAL